MKIQKFTTALAVVLFAGSVFAQSTRTTTTTRETTTDSRADRDPGMSDSSNRSVANQLATARGDQPGWLPAVHFGFGTRDQSGNSDLDGDAVALMFVGSYYFPESNWIADGGIGFQKNYFRNINTQPTTGLISLSGRYQFPQRWSIGPVADLLLGTTEEFGTANQYLAMAGLQGFKEVAFTNDALVRIGLKFTTEVGYADQNSNYLGLVLQWGVGAANPTVQSVSLNQ